jgi:cbb3-type cytochrome oxidase maturation protein
LSLNALFFQLGLSIVFIGLAAIGIFWAIKNGQYDDLDGPAQRILMDEDDPMIPFSQRKQSSLSVDQDHPNRK